MRTLRKKEARKYIEEFPFLTQLVPIERLKEGKPIGEIKIQVEVADFESLYIAPDFYLPPHWMSNADETLVGQRYPHVYAIKYNRVKGMSWDYDHQAFFSKAVLLDGSNVKALVILLVNVWYKNSPMLVRKGYQPELSHYEYIVHIFKKPEGGFEKLVREADLLENVRITNLGTIKSLEIAGNYDAAGVFREIKSLKDSIRETIGSHLWKITHEFKGGGMSGQFGSTELRTFTTGGRTIIDFVQGKNQITFVGDEKDISTLGCQSISSTLCEARLMINEVVANWQFDGNQLRPDNEVMPFG